MLHDDLPLMGPIVWFTTTDRRGATSVNAKLKVKDWEADPC